MPSAEEGGAEDGEEAEDTTVYEYHPPESRPWESLGSEQEINETQVVHNRPLVVQRLSRKRRLFGAPVVFKDRGPTAARDAYQECVDKTGGKEWDVVRKEAECGVQAVKVFVEEAAQTEVGLGPSLYPRTGLCWLTLDPCSGRTRRTRRRSTSRGSLTRRRGTSWRRARRRWRPRRTRCPAST